MYSVLCKHSLFNYLFISELQLEIPLSRGAVGWIGGWDPINQLTRAKSVLDVLTFYHYMYIVGTSELN